MKQLIGFSPVISDMNSLTGSTDSSEQALYKPNIAFFTYGLADFSFTLLSEIFEHPMILLGLAGLPAAAGFCVTELYVIWAASWLLGTNVVDEFADC
jgi:hypothetical protein